MDALRNSHLDKYLPKVVTSGPEIEHAKIVIKALDYELKGLVVQGAQ